MGLIPFSKFEPYVGVAKARQLDPQPVHQRQIEAAQLAVSAFTQVEEGEGKGNHKGQEVDEDEGLSGLP